MIDKPEGLGQTSPTPPNNAEGTAYVFGVLGLYFSSNPYESAVQRFRREEIKRAKAEKSHLKAPEQSENGRRRDVQVTDKGEKRTDFPKTQQDVCWFSILSLPRALFQIFHQKLHLLHRVNGGRAAKFPRFTGRRRGSRICPKRCSFRCRKLNSG